MTAQVFLLYSTNGMQKNEQFEIFNFKGDHQRLFTPIYYYKLIMGCLKFPHHCIAPDLYRVAIFQ